MEQINPVADTHIIHIYDREGKYLGPVKVLSTPPVQDDDGWKWEIETPFIFPKIVEDGI